jgi:hypothetical protein
VDVTFPEKGLHKKATAEITPMIAAITLLSLSCNKEDITIEQCQQSAETTGYNMLLIGNSFFKPYAEKLNTMAIDAGFEDHTANVVFRGGENGRPINFWNDSASVEHNEIKMALDQGNIDYFGMTAGKLPETATDGFREWIGYALQNNPKITIFLSIPPPDFPADWQQLAEDMGFNNIQEAYSNFVSENVHNTLVDQLRAEFPSISIFTIPTGWTAINLAQLNMDNLLLDNINISGPVETSIFTDEKGHQGEIVQQTGGLVWLNSIYNINLINYDYDTEFNTNLTEIAQQIMDSHDSNYKQ